MSYSCPYLRGFPYLAKDPASVDVQPVPDEALGEVCLRLQHGLEHPSLYDNPGKIIHYFGVSREEGTGAWTSCK
jgi:hypothetical protein